MKCSDLERTKRMSEPSNAALGLCVCIVTFYGLGCSEPKTSARLEESGIPTDAIVKVTDNGPVKATVTVWPAKPTLDGQLTVQLEVETEAGIEVKMPFEESALGRFDVASFPGVIRSSVNGKEVLVQRYGLTPPASGRHRIPPFRLEMLDARVAAGSAATGSANAVSATEILTEEIPIEIAPVDISKSNAELQPAAGELDVDIGKAPWWYYAMGGLGAVWIGLGIALLRRMKARTATARKVSAYDRAVAKLQTLESAGAPEATAVDPWFVELSSIVRSYLEDRYEINAPDRTTEEFLAEAAKAPELTVEHRGMLTNFLQRCDQVKFAGYRPDSEESIATLKAARGFVEESRLRIEAIA
jgi:hypothetical protein